MKRREFLSNAVVASLAISTCSLPLGSVTTDKPAALFIYAYQLEVYSYMKPISLNPNSICGWIIECPWYKDTSYKIIRGLDAKTVLPDGYSYEELVHFINDVCQQHSGMNPVAFFINGKCITRGSLSPAQIEQIELDDKL